MGSESIAIDSKAITAKSIIVLVGQKISRHNILR